MLGGYASRSGCGAPAYCPARDGAGLVFVPLALAPTGDYIGLPGGEEGTFFGAARGFAGREADYTSAKLWGARLFPQRDDAHAFYLFESTAMARGGPHVVVAGVLLSLPLPPRFDSTRVESPEALAAAPAGATCWASLAALRGDPVRYRLGSIALARAASFREPSPALAPDVRVGALGEHYLEPQRVLLAARAHARDFADVRREAEATMVDLRLELERQYLLHDDAAVRADLDEWLFAANRPLDFSELDASVRACCYTAADARLARVPFPHVACVASAPLAPRPPPPPLARVPSYATGWEHVLRPLAHGGALVCQLAHRAYYRYIRAHGTATGATKPRFWACGADSCFPWAQQLVDEGHVLVRRDGRITLLDMSVAPEFTLSPEASAHMLRNSADAALRDAVTTHGIVFHAKLEPQVVLMPPMESLADGFGSVLESMQSMIGEGYFSSQRADGLDDGRLCLGSVPGRHQVVGCVPKAYSLVWRMIVNNTYPLTPLYTTVGRRAPVVSLNVATGTDGDRAIRRAERPETAVRARRAPAVVSVQSLAQRAEYVPPARLPGSGDGAAVQPAELKAFFFELLVTISVLAHAGAPLGLVPVTISDDFAKAFHQFALALVQRWTSHIMMLDPGAEFDAELEQLWAGLGAAELAVISELCMSMGTTPSSNWCQRYTTEMMREFQEEFHQAHVALYERWEAQVPAFAAWRAVRAELSRETGRCECYLLVAFCFTDDPIIVTLCSARDVIAPAVTDGASLVGDASVAWGCHCRALRIKRGGAAKRAIGVQGLWVGGHFLTSGLIAWLGRPKMHKAELQLESYLAGLLCRADFRKLAGLLHHVVFTLALHKSVMYNLYDGLDAMVTAAAPPRAARALFLCGGVLLGQADDIEAVGISCGVIVDNYDVANCSRHDLTSTALQRRVLADIAALKYDFVHAGPRCRSYSIRHVPRLRSPTAARGILPVPKRWAAYLAADTALALFCVRALTAADDAGVERWPAIDWHRQRAAQ